MAPAFRIDEPAAGDAGTLRLAGRLRIEDGDALLQALRSADGEEARRIDLAGVETADSASAALLLGHADAHGGIELTAANASVQRLLALYRHAGAPPADAQQHHEDRGGLFEDVGRATARWAGDTKLIFGFSGQMVVGLWRALKRPHSVHWRDVGPLMERAGADGLAIVVLINFLMGLIMGYQAAIQLQRFGADVFIADLVGLSTTRELAPLMTAIIVAGRSGAAYAAELGTMRVREEIDALHTLCLDPIRFLVLPRVLALLVVVPLLTLLGDLVACLGGLLVGISTLDLTITTYLSGLQKAVDLWDVFGGIIKSAVFAVTIALISCQRGLTTRGGAAAVGHSTTSAVVIILFALVLLDAGFAVLWNALGI